MTLPLWTEGKCYNEINDQRGMQSVLAGGVSREIRPLFWYLTHSAIKRFSVAPRFCSSEESKIKPVLAGAVASTSIFWSGEEQLCV